MTTTLANLELGQLLPPSIRDDPTMSALGQAADPQLQAVAGFIALCLLLPRLDSLPDSILDQLAWQYHIEGYDKADTTARKREMVGQAIELHRYKGTPWAVETALSALGWPATVTEWFDYSGDAYKFKVSAEGNDRALTAETWAEIEAVINEWKNARSHLDAISITLSQVADGPVIGAACLAHEYVIIEPGD